MALLLAAAIGGIIAGWIGISWKRIEKSIIYT